ncbi:protein tyrosine phosphatase [Rhodobacteraceae bacterium 10Alg 79]|uniref:Protein tyrosine phosphatase n=2 Tax=Rhodalgimonas zhirmunskyi TaxID=2964767 RepID=A0AAJ1X5U1_9RHOB|nr:protein tyrosine phosphatase [Rhodoalgimonas zhirmunskyi]
MSIFNRLKTASRARSDRLKAGDITTPDGRRRARAFMLWYDHEFVRIPWSNLAQVAPGVWRSNQPTHARLARLKDRLGLKTVLFLRGQMLEPPRLFEEESCAELGLDLVIVPLAARNAPERQSLLDLIAAFRRIEKPFLMHCKSGADRASLASAVYLLAIEGAPVSRARRMLSLRFVHLKWTKTGIIDAFLDAYETAQKASGVGFEAWVENTYDAEALQRAFDAKRRGGTA